MSDCRAALSCGFVALDSGERICAGRRLSNDEREPRFPEFFGNRGDLFA